MLNAAFYSNRSSNSKKKKEANPIFRETAKVLTLPLKGSDRDISWKTPVLAQGSILSDDTGSPP